MSNFDAVKTEIASNLDAYALNENAAWQNMHDSMQLISSLDDADAIAEQLTALFVRSFDYKIVKTGPLSQYVHAHCDGLKIAVSAKKRTASVKIMDREIASFKPEGDWAKWKPVKKETQHDSLDDKIIALIEKELKAKRATVGQVANMDFEAIRSVTTA